MGVVIIIVALERAWSSNTFRDCLFPVKYITSASGNQFVMASLHADNVERGIMIKNFPLT